ncbi:DNA polymerase beta [Lepeophtheirus salmonis]|uniref:DNA polymerase beta n=1 Tax=Lepeophtheirus salmonis TaxID=72036 RepID=UPI001AEA2CEA|nr:DNA polymerase beta-like [Lepeophtheirus salmonis]
MSKRKVSPTKSSINNLNADFCELLNELATFEQNVNGNKFKSNAYRKAANVLSKHSTRITSGDEARKLDGIGAKIALKIDEFIETGNLRKLDNIRTDDKANAINLLTRVIGIGPVKARELVENEGIRTVEDLRKIEEKLTNAQKTYTMTICGSYRRGLPTSGDVDVLLTHDSFTSSSTNDSQKKGHHLAKVVSSLQKAKFITDTLSHGPTKFMGVCRLTSDSKYRRLDILLLPKDQYYCGVLYFTGSDMFNKKMRAHALEKGFTLNEHSLRPIDEAQLPLDPLPVSSEEDIFDYISFDYKDPEERSL